MGQPLNRRAFLAASTISGGALLLPDPGPGTAQAAAGIPAATTTPAPARRLPELTPARWLWYPSGRCLANTFVLFRREVVLAERPRRATGWIAADSRYRLEVNGQRVQWGPAPCDPRWLEADPLDLTDRLVAGRNVLGAVVLYYGHGDGTWPMGRPGFLFWLEIERADHGRELVVSDAAWRVCLARSWPAGHYKRWYLRALQEEFDARRYPEGWSAPGFAPGEDWLGAMELDGSPQLPAVCTGYPEYALDLGSRPRGAELRARSIPLLRETAVPVARLAESFWLEWRRSPEEYFECRVPEAFAVVREPCAAVVGDGSWAVELDGARGAVLTFELAEQGVGWPRFEMEAPAGTVVELLVHEAHVVGGPPLLNTHFDSWTRFTCREGRNRFETFDFESLRWLQLHVHGARGRAVIREVGLRRRVYPWPQSPRITCSDPALQRLFEASINTLHNCAQETLVDGMARERQQYSGDCGHQTHALYALFGETQLPARYLATFSQGLTTDGYFLDCWPAFDRLARLMERQVDLTGWGPILDHGVGFMFDCHHHHLYAGDLDALREPYPRLIRFAQYLDAHRGPDGLVPVEGLGVPSVWIDHHAFLQQRHKQCAFNLYAAAALQRALAPVAEALGDGEQAAAVRRLGVQLERAAVRKFWDRSRGLFVNNLPWLAQEEAPRLDDRSLATSVLFGQCPGNRIAPAVEALAGVPAGMGLSYPANAGWRLWALAAAGHPEVILRDLRERWATMGSVQLNRTLQEDWTAASDSGQQWSHCAVVPLYLTTMGLAGIRPMAPGFQRTEIRPQPGDLQQLSLTVWTPRGPIQFQCDGPRGRRALRIETPAGGEAELVVDGREIVPLRPAAGRAPAGTRRYALPAGREVTLSLAHT